MFIVNTLIGSLIICASFVIGARREWSFIKVIVLGLLACVLIGLLLSGLAAYGFWPKD